MPYGDKKSYSFFKKLKLGEAKSPFTMKSGNASTFKNLGSSPVKDTNPHTGDEGHTHEGEKASSSNWMQADTDFEKMKATKGSHAVKIAKIKERYGGEWKHKPYVDEDGNLVQGGYVNKKGQTPTEAEAEYLDASKNVG